MFFIFVKTKEKYNNYNIIFITLSFYIHLNIRRFSLKFFDTFYILYLIFFIYFIPVNYYEKYILIFIPILANNTSIKFNFLKYTLTIILRIEKNCNRKNE